MSFYAALDDISTDADARQKLTVGGLILTVPILNIAATGYEVRLARQVALGPVRVLPEWDEPGQLILEGLGLTLARAVYGLPALAVIGGALLAALPMLRGLPQEAAPGQPPPWLPLALLAGGALLFVLGWSLLLSLLSPAIQAQFARHGRFRSCFDWPAMARFVRRNWRGYLRAWAVLLVAGVVAGFLGTAVSAALRIIPCVGTPLNIAALGWLMFGMRMLHGHFTGQLLRADGARVVSLAPAG